MEMVHRPSPVLMAPRLHDSNCLVYSFVGFDLRASKVIKPAQDVVMPHRRKRKARPISIDDLAGAKPPEHSTLEQIFVGFSARLRNGCTTSPRTLVLQQPFENADRGIERGTRTRRRVTIPAAVRELLVQKTIHDAIAALAKVTADSQNGTVYACLGFTVEVRPVAETLKCKVCFDARDGAARFIARRVQSHLAQKGQCVHRNHPALVVRTAPPALRCLPLEQRSPPALIRDARSVERNYIVALTQEIAPDLPANRRISVQQPLRNARLTHDRQQIGKNSVTFPSGLLRKR